MFCNKIVFQEVIDMITAQLCTVLLLVIIFYMSFRIAAPRIRNVRPFKTVMYVSLASVILDANSIIMIANINSIGVEHIQGYYFSKPLKQADYLEFLKKNKESE